MSNHTKKPCDLETVITAEISIIAENVIVGENFDFETYKQTLEATIKKALFGHTRLKDDDIKVKVFLHEKSEKDAERE